MNTPVKGLLCAVWIVLSFDIAAQSISMQDEILDEMRQISLIDSQSDSINDIRKKGGYFTMIVREGDTMIVADIGGVNISAPRYFKSHDEYIRYLKYKRYAARVYPYAKEAIRIFKEAEYATLHLKKRKRKKYMKKLSKELEEKFEKPLSKLSKTQGKILVKMIERELETPMFDLIKNTRGRFKAMYWNQSSKLYGYRLKMGYEVGQNPILDIVLQDFDISYSPPGS